MDIFKTTTEDLHAFLKEMMAEGVLPAGLDLSHVGMDPPRSPVHGDMTSNAAMVLSKAAGLPPRDLAGRIAERLQRSEKIITVEIAGPGFINLRLSDGVWRECLRTVLSLGTAFGDSELGKGQRVNVEYVSANPTGPMHVGHARGAVVGDALCSLLQKAGYDVTREYYVNDAGTQVDVLARSAYLRYREAFGETVTIPEGLYPGDYLKPVGRALKKKYDDKFLKMSEEDWLPPVRNFALEAMMDLIREDLAALGVKHDVFSSERALVKAGRVEEALSVLEEKGLIYTGVLEPPKGKKPEEWEPRPQTLFRSTEFGDDVDRPLKKSNGDWTYFAPDIAYHYDKVRRGFLSQIDVLGADHGGYAKRVKAAVRALSDGEADLDVKLCQLVKLLNKGQPLKMSKRSGTFVTLRELVEGVGKNAVRFFMLTRKNDAQLDFDLSVVMEQSRDNPVFYVQYAHARCCSVLRLVKDSFPDMDLSPTGLRKADLNLLGEDEMAVIRRMAGWPRLVEGAALAHEPHRVAFYLRDLASDFHTLWSRGKEDTALRFIAPGNEALTQARMALIHGMRTVVASGLAVFGVDPVTELR